MYGGGRKWGRINPIKPNLSSCNRLYVIGGDGKCYQVTTSLRRPQKVFQARNTLREFDITRLCVVALDFLGGPLSEF